MKALPIRFGNISKRLFCGSLLLCGGNALAQTSPENQLVQVFWNGSAVEGDSCDCGLDSFVVVQDPSHSNTWYVGGVFGSAVGLLTNGNLNQSVIPARSIVKAVVNANFSVTCYSMSLGANATNSLTWGVSDSGSGHQEVETIVVSPAGDIFVGGQFGMTGTNLVSGNIGMYRSYDGWLHGHPFNSDAEVQAMSWNTGTTPGTLDVFGSITSICDGGSSESSTAHCYSNPTTTFWNPSLLRWNVTGK